jgi:hypothetical protein
MPIYVNDNIPSSLLLFQYFVFDFHMAPIMLFDKIITLTVSCQTASAVVELSTRVPTVGGSNPAVSGTGGEKIANKVVSLVENASSLWSLVSGL